jgi:hypothetical protein
LHSINAWLSIGKYRDTLDQGSLQQAGIGAMLQMAELVQQPGIATLYLPVEDGELIPLHLLAKGLVFVEDQRASEKNILIACGAGISRSVAFAMAALREVEGLSLLDAFYTIQDIHPAALPHPALLTALCSYYPDEPITDILQAIHHIDHFPLG